MTRTIALVAILGVAVGVLAGLAVGQLSAEAGAAPPCPPKCATPSPAPLQQRETEVSLIAELNNPVLQNTLDSYRGTHAVVAPDTQKFPLGAVFKLNVAGLESAQSAHCFRLVEIVSISIFNPIAGSEVCTTVASSNEYVSLKSSPLALDSGENLYMLQHEQDAGGGIFELGSARIVAEWTE